MSAGDARIRVGWSPPPGLGKAGNKLSGYQVWIRPEGATTWSESEWLPATAAELLVTTLPGTTTAVVNGTVYEVRVRARAEDGDDATVFYEGMTSGACGSDFSVMCTASPSAAPALTKSGAPTNVAVAAAGDGELSVSWSAPADTGGAEVHLYRVSYYKTADRAGTIRTIGVDGRSTSTTITGLDDGTSYSVEIRASTAAATHNSDFTAPVSATTPEAFRVWWQGNVRPGGDDLRVRADGDVSATQFRQAGLFFVATAANRTGTAVQCTFTNSAATVDNVRSTNCPPGVTVSGVGGPPAWTANQHGQFTGTLCGDAFQITARGTYTEDGVTFTADAPTLTGTLCGPYIPADSLTRISVGNGRIGVAWSSAGRTESGMLAGKGRPGAVVNSAELEYRAVGDTAWTSATIDINGGDNGVWYADTAADLTAGTAYEIRIRLRNNAADANAATNWWGMWHHRTTAAVKSTGSAPGAPGSLTATAGSAQIAVSWAAPASTGGAEIAYYRIRQSRRQRRARNRGALHLHPLLRRHRVVIELITQKTLAQAIAASNRYQSLAN